MFLHQKFGYKAKFVDASTFHEVEEAFDATQPVLTGFDTETDSLNHLSGYPFLVTFGFDKYVFAFEPSEELFNRAYRLMFRASRNFAHNVQYDHHMLENFGSKIPENIPLGDSMAVARLTTFSDDLVRLGLEALGIEYVDPEAKSAGATIRSHINRQNKDARDYLKQHFKQKFPNVPFQKVFDAWKDRVQFVDYPEMSEYFKYISETYYEATYETVYLEYPSLVINYAMDDVVIMLEFLKKALPVLNFTDPGHKTFLRESDLIRPVCEMERVGFLADVPYLLASRKRVLDYQTTLYTELYGLMGEIITVGQHKRIMQIYAERWGIQLAKADESSLEDVDKLNCASQAKQAAHTIIELRTVDKWLSTYIDGKLNDVQNGRLYTTINNSGAVSGRVSCNLQQQPKNALLDREGNELFHPRKVFLADPGHKLVFLDFSQMELRLQAYYTMLTSQGDLNMCRAYIPFRCISAITGEMYDPKNPEHMGRWDTGEWYNEKEVEWTPTDLHAVTTFNAFPHLENNPDHPEFKKLRKLGKMCNFLKNYQGGVKAIIEQMKVDPVTADRLDHAYYESFPQIRDYQQWVNNELVKHGFVENIYGRRYYMQNAQWFYKAGNYVIQGGCADMVKLKEIQVAKFLKPFKTRFVLPIHDELAFLVPEGEEILVLMIQQILQDVTDVMPWIPMISEIEWTDTNWADKKGWDEYEKTLGK